MSLIQPDSTNPNRDLVVTDYKSDGTLKNSDAEVSLVVGSASKAEAYIAGKQFALMWRDSDLLYNSPSPLSVFENTYILC